LFATLYLMEAKRLADQLNRSYDGVAWHGPSLRELLEGVTAEQAAAKPIHGAHSIWELVHHVEAWERHAFAVVNGKKYEPLKGEIDWPPVRETTAKAWQSALERLAFITHELVEAVGGMDTEKLGEQAGGAKYSFYVLLHGVVQHNLYHAGQIALLKKAVV
jgi:uncharacterized damage-inducible protein DinB